MIIDDIIRNPNCEFNKNKKRITPEVLEKLKIAQVVNITNVSDYVFGHPQEIWTIHDDVPNFAPPFYNMWLEWNAPKFSNINGRIKEAPKDTTKCKIAAHLQSVKNKENGGWLVSCDVLMQRPDRLIVVLGCIRLVVLEDGTTGEEAPIAILNPDILSEDNHEAIAADIGLQVAIVGIAISFMHCKNTILKQVSHPQKLQQARIKKGWKPLIRYHMLEIRPIKRILEEEGSVSKNGIQKALHICRGHFKDYREGKGLFGKYKDMYWWDMHTRGDMDNGLVVKDYKVMTK